MGRLSRHSLALACAALLAGASLSAQAGMFDDDEARKAILDLRTRVTQLQADQATQQQQQRDDIQQLRRALLDANNQIEALNSEIAKLHGENEELARNVADTQRHQKDVVQGVDQRIAALEPQQVNVDGKEFTADPDEKREYDDAVAPLKNGDFATTEPALQAFIKKHPGSGYIDSARFWLGNAQYGKREYKEAIGTFRGFVLGAPDHPRAPEAMLAIANCQLELKDGKGARRTLDELLKTYPKSEAAEAAKERLASLK